MTVPRTLTDLFFDAMDRYADRPVYQRYKRDGVWHDLSYRMVYDQVQALAAGLRALGVQSGERVAIMSENRPEWVAMDFACLTIRCADVPIYPTLPAAQAAYILRDSGAVAICCSNAEQLAKAQSIRDQLPALRHVIVFDADAGSGDALTFDHLLAQGRVRVGEYPDWRNDARRIVPDDLATLIYTSGTTGDPKGVMLTHGNIASNVAAVRDLMPSVPGDETVSFLPLSHIFERMSGLYTMLTKGVITSFAESFDTLVADIQARRPTVMAAVPRVYEKIYARTLDAVHGGSKFSQRVFFWAKRQGEAWATLRLRQHAIPLGLRLRHWIADRLVFARLRARMGNRVRFWVSGGAPLSAEIARFFYAAGMPILEGYGLTETSPVISFNTLSHCKPGTVGRPLPGVEVEIAPDGEILTRGPHVMRGYYNRPEATAEAIDREGWFHTGDIGELDDEGFLRITDRKKDIIVTAGGKNIAPQPIENKLKANPLISNAVMLGDRRKFPIVLLVPDFGKLTTWARAEGLTFTDEEALTALPAVATKMEAEMKKQLRDLARFEMPKKILVLPRDFSIERGELTPKMSIRRKVVESHFREAIDSLYEETPSQECELADHP